MESIRLDCKNNLLNFRGKELTVKHYCGDFESVEYPNVNWELLMIAINTMIEDGDIDEMVDSVIFPNGETKFLKELSV